MERALAIADLRRQRDERLLRASKAATMGTLALGITHELSTPLGVITGRTEQLLSRLGGDERTSRNLQAILDQAHHIGQIIRGFLGLVRGNHPPTEPMPPALVVHGAVALVEHRFAKAGVRLTTAVAEELPLVRGDLRLLEHALVNLLLNACDACAACGAGGASGSAEDDNDGLVEVVVSARGGHIEFAVFDSGAGISPADAERALEPFFTTKPAEEGTGLGLAIAQEIVKNHSGALHLSPRPEGGTCATIHLPIWQGDSHAD
jgi:two-component system, NtrC family, sensor kinase